MKEKHQLRLEQQGRPFFKFTKREKSEKQDERFVRGAEEKRRRGEEEKRMKIEKEKFVALSEKDQNLQLLRVSWLSETKTSGRI